MYEQFIICLATVTVTGERSENLDLCLALTTFRSEGSLPATQAATRDLCFYGHMFYT
jgi:hypothetical protein